MRAKMAAAKGSPADKPADAPKPLTIEKSAATATEAEPTTPVPVKKFVPAMKPAAGSELPPPKLKPVVISSAQLAELRDFHVRIVRPFLHKGRSRRHRLGDAITARRLFVQLRSDLPAELHETLEELEAFCEERRQFVRQQRLHRWMHWWLMLHIPPSIALMVLFLVHVVMSLRVVPWGR